MRLPRRLQGFGKWLGLAMSVLLIAAWVASIFRNPAISSPNNWTATLRRGSLVITGPVAPELRDATASPHGWSLTLPAATGQAPLHMVPATNVSSYGSRIVVVPLWIPILVLVLSTVRHWRLNRSNDARLHLRLRRSLLLASVVACGTTLLAWSVSELWRFEYRSAEHLKRGPAGSSIVGSFAKIHLGTCWLEYDHFHMHDRQIAAECLAEDQADDAKAGAAPGWRVSFAPFWRCGNRWPVTMLLGAGLPLIIDTDPQHIFEVPFWTILLIPAVSTFWLWRSSRRLHDVGHCRCGYNLTGNISGVCSECGTPLDGAASRAP